MIKQILYTKNPKNAYSFAEVVKFAESNNIYYTCMVNDESVLYDVEPGTHILTTKGNDLYVIETSFRADAFNFAKPSSITEPVEIDSVN